jgi:putative ATP-dependent endonuclease of OLD family
VVWLPPCRRPRRYNVSSPEPLRQGLRKDEASQLFCSELSEHHDRAQNKSRALDGDPRPKQRGQVECDSWAHYCNASYTWWQSHLTSRGWSHSHLLRSSYHNIYEWENDFPVSLQAAQPEGESVFIVEFELNDTEIEEFDDEVGSRVNEKLPIRLAVGRQRVKLTVNKRGRWATALSKKAVPIAQFVVKRVQFEYIEAVRTAKSAERVVDSLVEDHLEALESSVEYREALAVIDKVQKPVLDSLSKSIKETLVKFLPAIVDVKFEVTEERRSSALRRSATMIIDDGTPTSLEYKGDGVQSLAAIALMRHSSESASTGKNFIIAVEEPESHLHPRAMHGLKTVLQELAERHQVVITTHSPVFVDRSEASTNVIVQNGKARVARSINEIRDTLGVKASDNLLHAELVLILEGRDDSIALLPLLSVCWFSVKWRLGAPC